MLHTKPIVEISHADVVAFCEAGHREGFVLEFKREFPTTNDHLAKTVAAFANTYGGLLILGVNAQESVPTPPFEGMLVDPTVNYGERIQQIVLSHVKEPVFPEIQVCNSVNSRTFIVVRVQESQLAPHRTGRDRKIYVRTGELTTPNDEATWEQIEWLVARRKKSEELRQYLVAESERYFRDACTLGKLDPTDRATYFAVLSLRAVPLFPRVPLIDFRRLTDIDRVIQIHGPNGLTFPAHFHDPSLIQQGVQNLHIRRRDNEVAHGKPFEYVFLNTLGTYCVKDDIGTNEIRERRVADGTVQRIPEQSLSFYSVLWNIHGFLSSLLRYYEWLGFHGTCIVEIEINNALGVRVRHPLDGRINLRPEAREVRIPRDSLRWVTTLSQSELRNHQREQTVNILDEIAWSLGLRFVTRERIEQMLEHELRG